MFTGIVTDIGTVEARDGNRLRIASHYDPKALEEGASVACDGCCLTVTHLENGKDGGAVFEANVSNETASRTTLGAWHRGTRVNLERPLALGEELGGHLVTGHIDGVAKVTDRKVGGDSVRFVLETPLDLAHFIAAKGSVALNGVSLTVNEVDGRRFGVNIIPYSLTHTTWGDLKAGDLVNLEIDLLARYVERLASGRLAQPAP